MMSMYCSAETKHTEKNKKKTNVYSNSEKENI